MDIVHYEVHLHDIFAHDEDRNISYAIDVNDFIKWLEKTNRLEWQIEWIDQQGDICHKYGKYDFEEYLENCNVYKDLTIFLKHPNTLLNEINTH